MSDIKINPEFRDLIPKLSQDEMAALEASILEEGCRDSIVLWKDTIVDGHNRFEICTKHSVKFKTIKKDFENSDDVKVWMINNQLGRRNLTEFVRYELIQAKEEVLKKKGREVMKDKGVLGGEIGGRGMNRGLFETNKPLLIDENNEKQHNTRDEIAKDLGWSAGKVAKAQQVAKKADDLTKEKLRAGELSINQVYQEIKQPKYVAETPEDLLKKAKEVAKERAEEKRKKIDEKGSTPIVPAEDQKLIDRMKNGETVVLNMNTNFHAMKYAKDNDIFQRIDRFSEWGNPFHVNIDGDRDFVCESFEIYLDRKLSLVKKLPELKGKALACHCYPKRCHGDHLKSLADGE